MTNIKMLIENLKHDVEQQDMLIAENKQDMHIFPSDTEQLKKRIARTQGEKMATERLLFRLLDENKELFW